MRSSPGEHRWPPVLRDGRLALLCLVGVVSGCETVEREWREGPTEQQALASGLPGLAREVAMNRTWQNRRLSALRTALGEPRLIMQIPGGGSPPGFAAVYDVDPASGCVDAFAFVHDQDPVIRVYHCR